MPTPSVSLGGLLLLVVVQGLVPAGALLRPQVGQARGEAKGAAGSGSAGGASTRGRAPGECWVEQLSWKPRAYLFHNFLSPEEADHVIAVALPRIRRNSVIHANGTVGDDPIRTSWGTFINRAADDVIRHIDKRVAEWTHLPPSHAEDMQVLRYQHSQQYGAHWDETDPYEEGSRTVGGGRSYRVATVLMYLSDAEFGGETAFPRSEWLDEAVQTAGKEYSDCAKGGVAAHARKGDAILFWDMQPSGDKLDRYSMHTGCPVIRGVKWSATKWIHGEPFGWSTYHQPQTEEEKAEEERARKAADERRQRQKLADEADPCRDTETFCEDWAFNGECEKNPPYMEQACPRSCRFCCLQGDVLCERQLARRKRPQ